MVKQINPHLSDEQKRVLLNGQTEMPGTGALLHNSQEGTYVCANCGTTLFNSNTKYESTIQSLDGWPSFAEAVAGDAVVLLDDYQFGMHRKEAVCATCGGHLGHVFDDDSSPSGTHYCVNSASLNFTKKEM